MNPDSTLPPSTTETEILVARPTVRLLVDRRRIKVSHRQRSSGRGCASRPVATVRVDTPIACPPTHRPLPSHDVAVSVLLSDDVVVLRPLTSTDVDAWLAWEICEQETGSIVGGVELRDLGGREVDLSCKVFKAWRRRGIATRACRLALAYAGGVMARQMAVLKVRQGDTASLAVARKLGATVTGVEVSEDGAISVVLRLALDRDDQPGQFG